MTSAENAIFVSATAAFILLVAFIVILNALRLRRSILAIGALPTVLRLLVRLAKGMVILSVLIGHVLLLVYWTRCWNDYSWLIAGAAWFDATLVVRQVLRRNPTIARQRLWHPAVLMEGVRGANGRTWGLWCIGVGGLVGVLVWLTVFSARTVLVDLRFKQAVPRYLSLRVLEDPHQGPKGTTTMPGAVLPLDLRESKIAFGVWRRLPRRIRATSPSEVRYLALLSWDTTVTRGMYGLPGAGGMPGVGWIDGYATDCTVSIIDMSDGARLATEVIKAQMPGSVSSDGRYPVHTVEAVAEASRVVSYISGVILGDQ